MISSIKNRHQFKCSPISSEYTKLRRVQVEKNGFVSHEIQYVEYDCGESSRGVTPLDFSISNLLAVGAYGNLKPSYLRDATDFTFIDRFENAKV